MAPVPAARWNSCPGSQTKTTLFGSTAIGSCPVIVTPTPSPPHPTNPALKASAVTPFASLFIILSFPICAIIRPQRTPRNMQSFIIVNTSSKKRDAYLMSFLENKNINHFDVHRVVGESSIGIEEIRNLQKTIFLSPLKGNTKAIIVENAQSLTIEAQNALLKVLEEPPSHVIFFLSVSNAETLLPTILSRCSLITLEEEKVLFTQEQNDTLEQDASILFSENISGQLVLAEKIAADKENISVWLKNMILYLREKMLTPEENKLSQIVNVLKNLQEAHRIISTTNTQPRITLEHFFLVEN